MGRLWISTALCAAQAERHGSEFGLGGKLFSQAAAEILFVFCSPVVSVSTEI